MDENLVTLNVPQPSPAILTAAEHYTRLAQEYDVDCPEGKIFAVNDIRAIKARWDEIEAIRKNLKQPVDEAAKRIQNVFVPILDALDQAARTIKRKLDAYINEEEKEARRAQEDARQAALLAANKLREEAKAMEAQGRADEARATVHQAELLPTLAAAAVPEVATVAGTSRTERWSANVTDKAALVRAICGLDKVLVCLTEICELRGDANKDDIIKMIRSVIIANKQHGGDVPLAAVEPDMQFLNAQARALKSELHYAGVVAVSETSSTIRK